MLEAASESFRLTKPDSTVSALFYCRRGRSRARATIHDSMGPLIKDCRHRGVS